MGYRKNPVKPEDFRRLARERLLGKGVSASKVLTQLEVQHLLEELEIYQIELELQNEHLNAAHAQLEKALQQSLELYDFSPVGSLTLDQTGAISKLNLSGAGLLGGERARLVGSRFALYVAEADRPVLNVLLKRAQSSGEEQSDEISLASNGVFTRYVQIRIATLVQGLGWQVVLADMTEHRHQQSLGRSAEARWKIALDAVGDGVWDWNVQTGEVVFSRRYEQLYGFAEGQYGHSLEDWTSRLHPDDKLHVMSQIREHLAGRTAYFFNEHRGQCRDGSWKWVLVRGAIVSRTEDGNPVRMVGTHVDITGRKRAEDALLASARFQQAVFDSLSAHIAVVDLHGVILQTNAAWRKYALDSGFSDDSSCIGKTYMDIFDRMVESDQETVRSVSEGMMAVIGGQIPRFRLEHPFFAPSDKRWFSLMVTPVHDDEQRVVVSHEDVSVLKAAELSSSTLANTDALTGALSRRNFLGLAEQELARSTRYGLPLMVLMLDLDHFKRINDRFGHAAGDIVLQGFVQTVTGVLRESDLIGRLGGEEFAVLLPNTALDGGKALAHRILESVRASPADIGEQRIPYTVSIGAGCLTAETSFTALLGQADKALYRAKEGGRDRLEVGSP